jgi:uncharacterized protein
MGKFLRMRAVAVRQLYLSIFLVAAGACACARGNPLKAGPGEVRVEVTDVGMDRQSGSHFVVLEDESHRRQLPIMIGDSEAQAILLALHGFKPPRPLTQDLLRTIIQKTGNHLDRVLISGLHNEIYYAKIFLDGGKYTVDSRPSDAIALAMGAGAPIYVNEKLLALSSVEPMPGPPVPLPRNERGLGLTVQELTPEIAAYFKLPPKSGLLVATVDRNASLAGVKSGDIVTRIEGRPVSRLADFTRELSTRKPGAAVTLTIKRAGAERSVVLKAPTAQRRSSN